MSENPMELQAEATKIALTEIAEILEGYRAVIVGGFVPFLLIPQEIDPHVGTVDIDVVLDTNQPGGDDVLTLHEALERRLYIQDPKRPFRYIKGISIDGDFREVYVEFLGGGPPAANGLLHVEAEDVFVTVISGIEVALTNPVPTKISEKGDLEVLVCSVPAFLAMKTFALEQREHLKKQKDAYDIVYVLRNFSGGPAALAQSIQIERADPLVQAGLERLSALFASPDSLGPTAYSQDARSPEREDQMKLEAFQRVQHLLREVRQIP